MVSIAASQRQGPGFNSGLGSLSVWSLHILPPSAWDSSGCSGLLPQSKDVKVRLIGRANLPLSVREISRVNMWGYRDRAWGGIVVSAGLMGQMAPFCTVGIL